MPKRMRSSVKPSASLAGGWNPGLLFSANEHAFDCWGRGLSILTEEIGQFVRVRLQEDLSAWTELTSCKDPMQAFECQRRYVENATTDYLGEAGKLSGLTMTIANDSLSAFQGEVGAAA